MIAPSRFFSPEDLREAFPEYSNVRVVAENEKGAVFDCLSVQRGFRVALKLTADHGHPDTRERFEREFQILFTNQHHERLAHILGERGYRPVRMRNGSIVSHFFFTMKLYQSDVGKALREGKLDLCSRIIVVLQMLDGLCFLHAKGIAHRDIKPGNLFMEHVNAEQAEYPAHPISVKLGDFDIAKLGRAFERGRNYHPVGTLFYLAPERWQESRPDTDWRPSDQYAAGITAFQILANGPLPLDFNGLSDDQSPHAYQQVHMSGNKYALIIPERKQRGVYERFPRLERVLYRMIAINPSDRFENLLKCKLALNDALAVAGLWPCGH